MLTRRCPSSLVTLLPTEVAPVTELHAHTPPGDLEDARRLLDVFLVQQDVRATGTTKQVDMVLVLRRS